MANRDAPFGVRGVGTQTGTHNGQLTRMYIPATDGTAVFVGDLVKLAGSADAEGVPSIAQSTAGDTPCGFVVGFEPDGDDLTNQYRLASTARYALVNTDPNARIQVQEDSDTSTLAATNGGQNIDVVVGAGSTVSGLSGMELDSDTANTTSTLVLRIERLAPKEDNEIGTNAIWECSFNVHQFGSVGTTGV